MNPLKLSRLIRLILAIVFQIIFSYFWLSINHLQFLHYFPDETPLGLLMWSYVYGEVVWLTCRAFPSIFNLFTFF